MGMNSEIIINGEVTDTYNGRTCAKHNGKIFNIEFYCQGGYEYSWADNVEDPTTVV